MIKKHIFHTAFHANVRVSFSGGTGEADVKISKLCIISTSQVKLWTVQKYANSAVAFKIIAQAPNLQRMGTQAVRARQEYGELKIII